MAEKLKIPSNTRQMQLSASNPKNSAWVSANAGSGKTYVLTQRVIRLMLAGVEPARILCLTFTKAAATQMQNRVFKQLSAWVMLDDHALAIEIEYLTGEIPDKHDIYVARQLFAKALDTPGGLKIQTIHAFCESLLHQFPLEANIPGHFDVLDDLQQTGFLKLARELVLKNADSELKAKIELILSKLGDYQFLEAIDEIVNQRQAFQHWYSGGSHLAMMALGNAFGIDPDMNESSVISKIIAKQTITDAQLVEIKLLAFGSSRPTDIGLAERIEAYLAQPSGTEGQLRRNQIFLTQNKTIRKTIMTKEIKDMIPQLVEPLVREAELALLAEEQIKCHELAELTIAMFEIGNRVLEQYTALKIAREKADYDDLINATANLLERADIAPWIQYKLDQRIDHVLVDEAQDTSPRQWSIINNITDDFFSGEGGSKARRSMFAVGDHKQSIYSFQGAEPAEFSNQADILKNRVVALEEQGYSFENIHLRLSFRSTKDILQAVDKVFALPNNYRGLQADQTDQTAQADNAESAVGTVHESIRGSNPGEVHIWSAFIDARTNEKEDWLAPVDHVEEEGDPVLLLAQQITNTIAQWIGKPLEGTGRPIGYGDILVLVRKRDRFVTTLSRELKRGGLKVAGSDRLTLTHHIAVEDLIALARFMLMPEDDLSLASIFKSPLFDKSEDDLFRLAASRSTKSLFQALAASKQSDDQQFFSQLTDLRNVAREASVHDFFAHVLSACNGRRNMLARFGTEVEDVLDAFLSAALNYTQSGGTSLEEFIQELSEAEPDIKREFDQAGDEIRILTVHASKGLEAPIVFLVDPCSPAVNASHLPNLLKVQTDNGENCFLWEPGKDFSVSATQKAKEAARIKAEEEYHRLLYVGMTRAADRLVVCGYAGKRGPSGDNWLTMVTTALEDTASIVFEDAETGRSRLLWIDERKERKPIELKAEERHEAVEDTALPDWLFKTVRPEPLPPKPLTPSGAHALILKEALDRPRKVSPAEPAGDDKPDVFQNEGDRQGYALRKGTATHRLLQVLPPLGASSRQETARLLLGRLLPEANEAVHGQIIEQVFAILDNPDWQDWFSPRAQAEVPLCGRLNIKEGEGIRPRMVAGQIDRLYVDDKRAVIIDYKTDARVPTNKEDVPTEYLVQLSLYRRLIANIYPDRQVETGILWTAVPQLMIFPDEQFEAMDNLLEIRS